MQSFISHSVLTADYRTMVQSMFTQKNLLYINDQMFAFLKALPTEQAICQAYYDYRHPSSKLLLYPTKNENKMDKKKVHTV